MADGLPFGLGQSDPAITPEQIAILQANAAKGTAGNSVSQPPSDRWTLLPNATKEQVAWAAQKRAAAVAAGQDPGPEPPPGSIYIPSPNYTPPATKQAPEKIGSDEVGWYIYDPTDKTATRVLPPHTPNADEEMTKAIDRQTREAERNERQANELAGNGYVTTAELSKIRTEAAASKLGQDQLAQRIIEFGQTQKLADAKQATDDKRAAQEILQSQAQTGYIGAQTGQVQQNIDINAKKLPGELSQQKATQAGTEATTAYTDAQTARMKQLMGLDVQPTVQAAPSASQLWQYQRNPTTGAVTQTGINPEFQPKTQADIAARVGQIHSLMQTKSAEVQAKVGKNGYTADNALSEFNAWYAQNVTPQQAQLQAAQEDALAERARTEAATRTAALTAAQSAGATAQNAFTASQAGRVGPNWDASMQAAGQGKFYGPEFNNSVTYEAPDINQTSQQAVMDALKYISPTAAAATGNGMPNYAGVDIAAGLDKTPYLPGGMPPGGAPPVAVPVPGQRVVDPALLAQGVGAGAAGAVSAPVGVAVGNAFARMPPINWQQMAPNFGTYSYPG